MPVKKALIFCFVIFSPVFRSIAQTPQIADSHIATLFDKMDFWCQFCYKDMKNKKVDSLRNSSGRIYDYIENIINMYPFSLTADFPQAAAKGLHYQNSEDGELRIYSWKAKMEGHGPEQRYEYRDIAAFKTRTGRKYHDISNGTEGAYCAHITTIHTKKDITIYLAIYYSIENGLKSEKIKAYAIIDDNIKDMAVFMKGTKNPRQLYCDYDPITEKLKSDFTVIQFSKDKTKLYIPVTDKKDGKPYLTGQYMAYIFNGSMYVFDKIVK